MRSLTACLLTLSALALNVMQFEPAVGGEVRDVLRRERLPCYVVVSDEVHDDDQRRAIRIMMGKDDVNEANFVKLQRHFSALYAHDEHFRVQVCTSLNFILGNYTTVEDVERRQAGLTTNPKVWEKDTQGFLMREGETEEFGYKRDGGDMKDMKYVLVKGEDPDCHACERLKAELLDTRSTIPFASRKTRDELPCYFAIGDSVTNGRRLIGLFINPEDGNESNLLALLSHFSRQYPEPETLEIRVYANLKQSNDFVVQLLGDHFVPATNDYFVGAIFRDSGNKVIRYRHPKEKVVTLVV